MQFEIPTERPSIIKVIGVGGGGSNAVNHMFKLGIKGVDFIICNTDNQALEKSPVPIKVQLGPGLTQGLGAGAMPEVGRKAALENTEEIKEILRHNTKMVFITAGMGGGTGTGAAPIIASIAREMGILTVGIVTIPFGFEGKKRKAQADAGVEEMRKNVDTLLVICNDKLREIHGDLKLREAFGHADDILAIAAKSIAEIITTTLHINVDFADIQTVMKGSGVAIMGSSHAEGANRSVLAVEKALHSPLLNDNSIEGARYILLNITSGNEEITMDEMTEITDYIQERAGHTAEVIMGVGTDETLQGGINVTVIATGFKTKDQLDTVITTQEQVTKYNISGEIIANENQSESISTEEVTEVNNIVDRFVEDHIESVFQITNEEPSVEPSVFELTDNDDAIQSFETEMTLKVIDEVEDEIENEIEVDVENLVEEAVEDIPSEDSIEFSIDEPVMETTIGNSNLNEITFEIGQVEVAPELVSDFSSEDQVISDLSTESDVSLDDSEITADIFQFEEKALIVELKNDQIDDGTPFVYIKPHDLVSEAESPIAETKSPSVDRHSSDDEAKRAVNERMNRIREFNLNYNTPNGLNDMEKVPAYKRRGVQFENSGSPSDVEISKLSLTGDNDGRPEIRPNNPFLHDRVD
ncbi:MAG: cell division protein FtsZ [Arcticibacter sp.]